MDQLHAPPVTHPGMDLCRRQGLRDTSRSRPSRSVSHEIKFRTRRREADRCGVRRRLGVLRTAVLSPSEDYEKHVRSEMAARVMTAMEMGERDPISCSLALR